MKRDKFIHTKKRFLWIKVFTIFYVICLGLVYLTSSTEAQFTNTRVHNEVIQAGEWWDGSSLTFVGTQNLHIASCGPVELAIEVKNDSRFGMYGTSEYEIYHAFTHSRITEQQFDIPRMAAGSTSTLTYTVSGAGEYVFLVYQRPKYRHNEVERTSIKSEVITVTCVEESIPSETIDAEEGSSDALEDESSNVLEDGPSDVLEDEQDHIVSEEQLESSVEEDNGGELVGEIEADE